MDRNAWFGAARALSTHPADKKSWEDHLLPLVDKAHRLSHDEAELAEVFIPYLVEQAARWPDALRVAPASWRDHLDARWRLVRAYEVDGHEALGALPGILPLAPGLRRLNVSLSAEQLLDLELPAPHALDTLALQLDDEDHPQETRWMLDALPGWVRHLICLSPYARAILPNLPALSLDHLTLCRYDLGPGLGHERLIDAIGALRRLRALTLVECAMGEQGAQALADAGALRTLDELRELTLDQTVIGEAGARALLDAGALDKIEVLCLRSVNMWDDGATALAAGRLRALKRLTLTRNELTSKAALAMSHAPWLARLDELDVRDNRIGPEGLVALRESVAPGCELLISNNWGAGVDELGAGSLVIRDTPVSPPLLREILRVAAHHQTSRLHIQRARLDDATLTILLDAELPHLKELLLPGNNLGLASIQALTRSPLLAQLTVLDLSSNYPLSYRRTDPHELTEALNALLRRAASLMTFKLNDLGHAPLPTVLPPTLRALELVHANLSDEDARRIIAMPGALEHLDLSHNHHIGPLTLRGIQSAHPGVALRCSGCWGAVGVEPLDELELRCLGPEPLVELAELSSSLHALRSLDLHGPKEPPLPALERLRPPALVHLLVTHSELDAPHLHAMEALLGALVSLGIYHMSYGDQAAEALSKMRLVELKALCMERVQLTARGVALLLPTLPSLIKLDLSDNPITSEVAPVLLGWELAHKLEVFELRDCHIGPVACTQLIAAIPHIHLSGCWGMVALEAVARRGELDLWDVSTFTVGQMGELASWPGLSQIVSLDLRAHPVTDAEALELAASPHLTMLDQLTLSEHPQLTARSLDALRAHIRVVEVVP